MNISAELGVPACHTVAKQNRQQRVERLRGLAIWRREQSTSARCSCVTHADRRTDLHRPLLATAESSLTAACKGCCKDRMRRHSTRRAASQRRQRTAVSLCSPSVDAHFQSLHRSSACNSLPSDIQSSSSLSVFRQLPKTFLFRQSFPDIVLWRYCAFVDFVIVLLF